MKLFKLVLVVIALTFLSDNLYSAQVTTFDSRPDFQEETGAVFAGNLTIHTSYLPVQEQPQLGLTFVTRSENQDSGINIVNVSGFNQPYALTFGYKFSTVPLAWYGDEANFDILLDTPVYSFGFRAKKSYSAPASYYAPFEVSLFYEGQQVGDTLLYQIDQDGTKAKFFGVWSTSLIDEIQIRDIGIYNTEYFSDFYYGYEPSPIPEPATTFLLSLSFLALCKKLKN